MMTGKRKAIELGNPGLVFPGKISMLKNVLSPRIFLQEKSFKSKG